MGMGPRLKEARAAKKWSQKQLAVESGLDGLKGQKVITNIERFDYKTSEYAPEFARALGVTLEWLMTGEGQKYPYTAEDKQLLDAFLQMPDQTKLAIKMLINSSGQADPNSPAINLNIAPEPKRAKQIAHYFLHLDEKNDGGGISNLKLQKLVYYAQGYYSAIFNKPLFKEDIFAWQHGPVIPDLYHAFKKFGSDNLQTPDDFDPSSITKEESSLIYDIYDEFGQFAAWKLRDMTHQEPPWKDHSSSDKPIPFEEITSYFKEQLDANPLKYHHTRSIAQKPI